MHPKISLVRPPTHHNPMRRVRIKPPPMDRAVVDRKDVKAMDSSMALEAVTDSSSSEEDIEDEDKVSVEDRRPTTLGRMDKLR